MEQSPAPAQVAGTDEARTGTNVVAAAALGTSGMSTRLPFADIIQRAFGRHDISDVNAHAGVWCQMLIGAERVEPDTPPRRSVLRRFRRFDADPGGATRRHQQ
jgi:hypothetical protein